MQITNEAITAIACSNRIKNLLAAEFDCSEQTIKNWLKANADNGDLTKKKAVEIISSQTGLTEEQILTEEKVN